MWGGGLALNRLHEIIVVSERKLLSLKAERNPRDPGEKIRAALPLVIAPSDRYEGWHLLR